MKIDLDLGSFTTVQQLEEAKKTVLQNFVAAEKALYYRNLGIEGLSTEGLTAIVQEGKGPENLHAVILGPMEDDEVLSYFLSPFDEFISQPLKTLVKVLTDEPRAELFTIMFKKQRVFTVSNMDKQRLAEIQAKHREELEATLAAEEATAKASESEDKEKPADAKPSIKKKPRK